MTLKAVGEEANSNVMKIVKTDKELAQETRDLVDALVGKMLQLKARGLVVGIGLANGANGEPVELTFFKVEKVIDEFRKQVQPTPQRR